MPEQDKYDFSAFDNNTFNNKYDFSAFEEPVKKKDGGKELSSVKEPKADLSFLGTEKPTKPVSESTKQVQTPQAEKLAEQLPIIKEKKEKAINDAVNEQVKFRSSGYLKDGKLIHDNPADRNKFKQQIQAALDNGDLVYDKGKIVRSTGIIESFTKSIKDVDEINKENNYIANLSKKEAINYLKNKIQHPEAYKKEETAPSNVFASLASMVGRNLDLAAKTATGAIAGVALAPETGGTSFGQFLATVKDFAYGGYAQTLQNNYQKLKQQDPNISDSDAFDKAQKSALVSEALQIGTAAVFAKGDKVKVPEATASPKGVVEGIGKSFIHTAKEAAPILGVTAAASVGTDIASKVEGVDVKLKDVWDNASEQVKGTGSLLFSLWGLSEPFRVASYIRPQMENLVSSAPKEDVYNFYKKGEELGTLPQGTTEKVMSDLNNFEKNKKIVPEGLSDESRASLAGIVTKRDKIQKEIDELHKYGSTFQAAIEAKEAELNEWSKQADAIYKTDNPFAGAKDNLTGEPLEPQRQIKKEAIPEKDKTLTVEELTPAVIVDGKEYTGENHGEAMNEARKENPQANIPKEKDANYEEWRTQNGGFKDNTKEAENKGEFITRNEADERHGVTRSEDLIKPEMEVKKEKVTPTEKVIPKEEKTFAQKDLDRAEAKRLHGLVKDMPEPTDAEQIALRYLADGGKISEQAINEVAGTAKRARLNTGERELKSTEAKTRDYYSKTGETLDELSHRLWENSNQEISERDIKDALMDAIGSHNSRLEATKSYLERYNPEYIQEQYYNRLAEEKATEHAAEEQKILDWLSGKGEEEYNKELEGQEEHINNLIKQYEAEFKRENQPTTQRGETETNKEISSRTSGEEPKETKEVIEPPKPPKEEVKEESKGDEGWTSFSMKKLPELKESFRRINIGWDERSEAAIKSLSDEAKGLDKSIYETAKNKMTDLYNRFKENAKKKSATQFSYDDQIQMMYLRLDTEQRLSNLYDALEENPNNTLLITERDNLLQTLDNTYSTIQAMRSESGVGLGLGGNEAILDPNHGLQVRRMQMAASMGVDNLSPEMQKFTSEQWEKEKEIMQKEAELKQEKLKKEFEDKIKDLEKTLKEKGVSPTKAKIFSESGKELADKLRARAEKIKKSDFLKAKLPEGTQKQGVDFYKLAGEALEKIADAVEKGGDLLQAISEYAADKFKGEQAKKFEKDLINFLSREGNIEEYLNEIKNKSKELGVDNIHPEMTSKDLIKNFVNSYVGEVPVENILETAVKDLKEVLPNTNEEQIRDAYLNKGQFEKPTKEKTKSILVETQKTLFNIVRLETEIEALKKGVEISSNIKTSEKEYSEYEKNLMKQKSDLINEKRELEKKEKKTAKEQERLDEIDRKIKELKDTGDIVKEIKKQKAPEIDKKLQAKKEELDNLKVRLGVKDSSVTTEEKDRLVTRGNLHNQRLDNVLTSIDEVSGKSEKLRDYFSNLYKSIKDSKAKVDINSELSQEQVLNKSKKSLENSINDIDRKLKKTIVPSEKELLKKVKLEMQGALDKFNSDMNESLQDAKLKLAKEKLKSDIKELRRKIFSGEFEEEEPKPKLTKTDVELLRLQTDKKQLESAYEDAIKKERIKNGSKVDAAIQLTRGANVFWLIKAPSTMIDVGWSGLFRPMAERRSKQFMLPVLKKLAPEISEVAKSGGESSSALTRELSRKAQFRGISKEKLDIESKKLKDKAKESNDKYLAQKELLNSIKDKNSNEYKSAKKLLDKYKKEATNDALRDLGNVVFEFIGSNSWKEAAEVFLYRSAQIEQQFGEFSKELPQSFKRDKNSKYGIKFFEEGDTKSAKVNKVLEDLNYMMGFIGRAHSAAKGFSGRAAFAESMMAKLEYAFEHNEDITSFGRYMELAHEAYLDWDRGKYQQKNFITDAWNGIMRYFQDKYKGTEWEAYGKALSTASSLSVAITRVPVNMLHEFVAEYTLGALRATGLIYKITKEAKKTIEKEGFTKGIKEVDGVKYGTTIEEYEQALSEQIKKLPKEQAALVARCFRKGGFGLGIYALSALGISLGLWGFGGLPHKGQTQEDKKKKEGELKAGEIEVLGQKMPEYAAKAIEHTNVLNPALFGESIRKQYQEELKKGESEVEALNNTVMRHLKILVDRIPQAQIAQPIERAKDFSNRFFKRGSKIEEDGKEIDVRSFDYKDQIRLLTGMLGGKEEMLTEDNYKLSNSVISTYKGIIANIVNSKTLTDEQKEEKRKEAFEKRDKLLEKIREANKKEIQRKIEKIKQNK